MPTSKKSIDHIKPYWKSECGRATIYVGDNIRVMENMTPSQFHAIVTDPPYGLEFMGKDWDAPWKSEKVNARTRREDELDDPVKAKYLRHNIEYVYDSILFQKWFFERAVQMLRVSKPGAHLLSFGGTRMWHRMACAIEDAGFEIRDTIMWAYGSGFPKGQNISKAIDKLLGAERPITGPGKAALSQGQFNSREMGAGGYGYKEDYSETAPATDEAKQWNGWNTALKPALEPIIMARRAPIGSIAQNTLEQGCGGINVDGCRVGTTGQDVVHQVHDKISTGSGIYQFNSGEPGSQSMSGGYTTLQKDGRWPANLIHDGSEEAVAGMPGESSRYFYSAKADDDDRSVNADGTHPTVKPLDLMRYLLRLVCAKGGTVLDPFMGSGSTGCAAIAEGVYFVGIEQSEEYAKIAIDRIQEILGTHQIVKRLESGQRVVKDSSPPPRRLR